MFCKNKKSMINCRDFTFLSPNSYRAFAALPTTERRLGAGGGYTIGSQNHKRSISPQKVIRSYTPACAKPLVMCRIFQPSLFLFFLYIIDFCEFAKIHDIFRDIHDAYATFSVTFTTPQLHKKHFSLRHFFSKFL